MHVMFRGSAKDSEGDDVIEGEWKVVADVSLDADDDGENHVAPDGHGVAVEEPGVGGGEEADRDQLPGVEVLRHPDERRVVFVVKGVDVLVEESNLVVAPVPDEVLEVEDEKGCCLVPEELERRGGQIWQVRGRGPDPLGDGRGQNVEHLIPDRQRHGIPHLFRRYFQVTLNFIFLDPLPVFAPQVHDHEGYADAEEKTDA